MSQDLSSLIKQKTPAEQPPGGLAAVSTELTVPASVQNGQTEPSQQAQGKIVRSGRRSLATRRQELATIAADAQQQQVTETIKGIEGTLQAIAAKRQETVDHLSEQFRLLTDPDMLAADVLILASAKRQDAQSMGINISNPFDGVKVSFDAATAMDEFITGVSQGVANELVDG